LGDVEVAGLDQLGHVSIEEREQHVRSAPVHVRVAHEDIPVVSELRDVEAVIDPLDAAPRAMISGRIFSLESTLSRRPSRRQHFPEHGQDRLEASIPAGLRRAYAESPSTM